MNRPKTPVTPPAPFVIQRKGVATVPAAVVQPRVSAKGPAPFVIQAKAAVRVPAPFFIKAKTTNAVPLHLESQAAHHRIASPPLFERSPIPSLPVVFRPRTGVGTMRAPQAVQPHQAQHTSHIGASSFARQGMIAGIAKSLRFGILVQRAAASTQPVFVAPPKRFHLGKELEPHRLLFAKWVEQRPPNDELVARYKMAIAESVSKVNACERAIDADTIKLKAEKAAGDTDKAKKTSALIRQNCIFKAGYNNEIIETYWLAMGNVNILNSQVQTGTTGKSRVADFVGSIKGSEYYIDIKTHILTDDTELQLGTFIAEKPLAVVFAERSKELKPQIEQLRKIEKDKGDSGRPMLVRSGSMDAGQFSTLDELYARSISPPVETVERVQTVGPMDRYFRRPAASSTHSSGVATTSAMAAAAMPTGNGAAPAPVSSIASIGAPTLGASTASSGSSSTTSGVLPTASASKKRPNEYPGLGTTSDSPIPEHKSKKEKSETSSPLTLAASAQPAASSSPTDSASGVSE